MSKKSDVAGTIAVTTGYFAAKWALIAAVGSVTVVGGGAAGVIAGAAGFVSATAGLLAFVDPPPRNPPLIHGIVNNLPTGVDSSGRRLRMMQPLRADRITAGQIVSVIGTGFSFVPGENIVTVNGTKAPVSPAATNTELSFAMPLVHLATPEEVNIEVVTNDVHSEPHTLVLEPAKQLDSDARAWADTVLRSELDLIARLAEFDWKARFMDEIKQLAEMEQGLRLSLAYLIKTQAKLLRSSLQEFVDQGQRQAVAAYHQITIQSPEYGSILDEALAMLQ